MTFNREEAIKASRFLNENQTKFGVYDLGGGRWSVVSSGLDRKYPDVSDMGLMLLAFRLGWTGYSTKGWSWEEHFIEISEDKLFIELDGELYVKACAPTLTPIQEAE